MEKVVDDEDSDNKFDTETNNEELQLITMKSTKMN